VASLQAIEQLSANLPRSALSKRRSFKSMLVVIGKPIEEMLEEVGSLDGYLFMWSAKIRHVLIIFLSTLRRKNMRIADKQKAIWKINTSRNRKQLSEKEKKRKLRLIAVPPECVNMNRTSVNLEPRANTPGDMCRGTFHAAP